MIARRRGECARFSRPGRAIVNTRTERSAFWERDCEFDSTAAGLRRVGHNAAESEGNRVPLVPARSVPLDTRDSEGIHSRIHSLAFLRFPRRYYRPLYSEVITSGVPLVLLASPRLPRRRAARSKFMGPVVRRFLSLSGSLVCRFLPLSLELIISQGVRSVLESQNETAGDASHFSSNVCFCGEMSYWR